MKRAILATAGTLTGLVSVLSYSPTSATTPLAEGGTGGAGLGGPGLSAPAGNETPAGRGGTAVAAQSAKGTAAKPAAKAATARPAAKPAAPPAGAAKPASHPAATPTAAAAAVTTRATTAAAPQTTAAAAPRPTTAAPKPVTTKATSQAPAPTPTVTVAKDYIGSAITYKYGTLQIGIRVQGGKIIDAWAVKYPMGESQPYSEMAIPILRSQTLSAQSARIAGASGATLTSQSWIKSLTAALSLAGM